MGKVFTKATLVTKAITVYAQWQLNEIVSTTLSGNIAIIGTPRVGNVLAAIPNISPTGNFNCQWMRGNVQIAGENPQRYTLVSADHGKEISVEVTIASYSGAVRSETVEVEIEEVEEKDTPAFSGQVYINGNFTVGEILTAVPSSTGTGNPDFKWKRNNDYIPGANAQSYFLASADQGKLIWVEVTYANGSISSTPTIVTGIPNPPLTGQVYISGNSHVGETLIAVVHSDANGTFSYRWRRDNEVISSNSIIYKLANTELGKLVTVEVMCAGYEGSIRSTPATVTAASSPDPVAMPSASPPGGTFTDGQSRNVALSSSTPGATIFYFLCRALASPVGRPL